MEEIEKTLSPTVDTVVTFATTVWLEYLTLVSLPQAAAIAATLFLAIFAHRSARRFIQHVDEGSHLQNPQGLFCRLGIGLGANALIGGNGKSIGLQPVAIQGSSGLNIAVGLASLILDAVSN